MTIDVHGEYEVKNTTGEEEDDPFAEDRYRQLFRFLPRDARTILDVGCNDGRGGRILSGLDRNLDMVGLDCVQAKLDALPSCYGRRIYGLSNKMPVEDGAFDVVLAGEFLEHLYPSDVDSTLWEFQRVLKIGGRLLLTTPNPNYFKRRLEGSSVYCSYHLTQHFPRVLKLRLMMQGFSRVRIYGSGRVSRVLGAHFPLLNVYGSYLVSADKR